MSRFSDATKAYSRVVDNGWGRWDALKAARMVFSAGGFGGMHSGLHWPNTFRKLTDPWHERAGFDPTGIAINEFWRNSTAQACLAWMQRTFPEPPLMVAEGEGTDREEVDRHPLTRLLRRPNPHFTAHRLWQATLADWWITGHGNAYWVKVRDGTGEPVELWHAPAVEMEPEWPRDGSAWISHYVRTVNGQRKEYAPEDVVHFRFNVNPMNQRKGWCPVLAGMTEIAILNEGARYRAAILHNHGVPSYGLIPQDETSAAAIRGDRAKAELLEKVFQSKFTGSGRGGLFVPSFVANLEKLGYSPQELDIRELMEWDADIIAALFGLNTMILGLPSGEKHRTFANMAEARESAFESNVIPTQACFAEELSLQLLPDFDDREERHVAWDYSRVRVLQEDENQRWDRILQARRDGVLTRNEARLALGYEELDEEEPPPRLAPASNGAGPPTEEPEEELVAA